MSNKTKNPFAERFKKVDGGKTATIASAWENIVKEKKQAMETTDTGKNTATETEDMIKISLWVPKVIKKDIDEFIKSLKGKAMSKPFAKSSVILRQSLEIGYPKLKEHIMGLFVDSS